MIRLTMKAMYLTEASKEEAGLCLFIEEG